MIKVFGITGTNGKTTASYMLRNILEQTAPCGLIGTVEYIIKNRKYKPCNTTPGKDVMTELLEKMTEENVSNCVMEVSSHGIHQGRINDIMFAGAGFTNLTRDHLDYHGTMENYYQVKKQLFIKNGIHRTVNLDDEYGVRLYRDLSELIGAGIIEGGVKGFSLEDAGADFYGEIVNSTLTGTDMKVFREGKLLGQINIPIPGRHFASDALLAASMALQGSAGFDQVCKGIKELYCVPGRMEIVGNADDIIGIVDYAHTPDSLEKLLLTVNGLKKGKVLCVFGCGGYRDKGKRGIMGEIAGKYSDFCIITNDNPRGEAAENIAEAIEEGLRPGGCPYCIILDRYQAIKRAVSLAGKWDIIVVAGKGHETYQIIGSEKVPFDDRKVLKEFLEKKV